VIFSIGDEANVLCVIRERAVLLTDTLGNVFSDIHEGEVFSERALFGLRKV